MLSLANAREDLTHTSRLLNLPYELLLVIADFLPLHRKIALSQTCWPLRNRFHDSCVHALSKLTTKGRKALLCAIGDDFQKPYQFVCVGCENIHTSTASDSPHGFCNIYSHACHVGEAPIAYYNSYHLHHRHVQMALRYSRNGSQPKHLAILLKPRFADCCLTLYPAGGGIKTRKYIEPRIIRDRFILYLRKQILCVDEKRLEVPQKTPSLDEVDYASMCPHMQHWGRDHRTSPPNQLTIDIERTFQSNVDVHGSCPKCQTDYTICKRVGSIIFEIWQDFGSSDVPGEPGWHRQVWDFPPHDNTYVAHEAGSVRDLYRKNDISTE